MKDIPGSIAAVMIQVVEESCVSLSGHKSMSAISKLLKTVCTIMVSSQPSLHLKRGEREKDAHRQLL